MRLRTKFAIVLVVAALVLSGVVYFGLESSKTQAVAEKRTNVAETATLTADQIDASLDRQTNYVGFHASTPAARDFGNSSAFLEAFLLSPRFYAAELVAANGTVIDFQGDVTASAAEQAVGADHSDKTFVQHPLRTGETYVSAPDQVNGTDQLVVIVSAPIFDGEEVVGVLAAAFPLNEATLFSVVMPLETDEQSVAIIGQDRVIRSPHRTFDEAITESATVERTGWTVVVHRDRAPLTWRLQQLAVVQSVSLLIVFGVIVSLALVEYEILLKQTRRLLEGFDAFREGNYDYDLTLGGGEEWEVIADRFTLVGDALAEREAALRESEQRLSVLNRVLRHNLRNDMTVVLNYAKQIEDESSNEAHRAAADRIVSKARDLVALGEGARQIEDALSMEAPRQFDVTAAVSQAVASVRDSGQTAAFAMSVPDQEIELSAHPALGLAVERLVDNAIRHNDTDDPRVHVALEDTEDEIRITVADNGPGLPETERTVLSDAAEKPLEHGSGLGLWLAYWVVEKSEGTLRFEPNEPRGTIAIIELPRDTS